MAVTFNGTTQAVKRLTNLVSGAGDYSCVFWMRNNALPPGGARHLAYVQRTTAYDKYIRILSNLNSSVTFPNGDDGSGAGSGSTKTLTVGTWFAIAMRREAGSGGHYFFRAQGAAWAGLFVDTAATPFDELWLGGDGTIFSTQSFAYFREWNTALTNLQLNLELGSPTALVAAGLVTDTPLTTDLLDVSGNGNHWTGVGSPTFEASPAQTLFEHLECCIGATNRHSWPEMPNTASITGISGGADGAPLFQIYNDSGQAICSINIGSAHAPGSSVSGVAPVTAVQNCLCLAYFNKNAIYQTPTLVAPWTDDLVGFTPCVTKFRDDYTWRQWKMRVRTSSFDFLSLDVTTDPFHGTWLADGEIEVIVDGVTLFTYSGIEIRRARTSWFDNRLRFVVYPCGDMDSLWICNTQAYPTVSGAQNLPTGTNLQILETFNSGAVVNGWTNTRLVFTSATGVKFNATAGLDGTIGISTTTTDAAITCGYSGTGSTPYGAIALAFTLTPPPPSPPTTGAILVLKETDPPGSLDAFSMTAGGGLTPTSFTLHDGENRLFSSLTPASGYSVDEPPVAGWDTVITVSNGDLPSNITVAEGETVIVTITNTSEQGTIVVVKETVPSGSLQGFAIVAGGGLTPTNFTLHDGELQVFSGLTPSAGYTVAEPPVLNWATGIVVSNGDLPDNISVAANETVTVTITNTRTSTPAPGCVPDLPVGHVPEYEMALTPRFTLLAVNTKVAAQAALANGGRLAILNGTQPATGDSPITTQTTLVVVTLGTPAFGDPVLGVAALNPVAPATAINSGIPSWCRFYRSDGVTAICDGSVGLTSDYNLIVSASPIVIGATVTVLGFTMTEQLG